MKKFAFKIFGTAFICLLPIAYCSLSSAHALFTYKPIQKGGLIAQWTFDSSDISGTIAYDKSGQGNNGTLVGGPANANGKIGQARSFNGSSQYVTLGNTSAFDFGNSTSFSVSSWVKPTSVSGYVRIVSNGHNGFTNGWLLQSSSGFGSAGPATGIGAGGTQANSIFFQATSALTTNQWSHVMVVFNQSTKIARMYVNGQQVPISKYASTCGTVTGNDLDFSACTSITANHNNNTTIASWIGSNEFFTGSMDDVRIYNRALSSAEVAALYRATQIKQNATAAATKLSNSTGPVGHWSFDGNAMTNATATDVSGRGNDGTLMNSPSRVVGKIGQALNFNGVQSSSGTYVTVPSSSSLQGFTAMTACGWVYLRSYNTVDGNPIIVKSTTAINTAPADPYQLYALSLDTVGAYGGLISTGIAGSRKIVTSAETVGLNAWHFLCMTYDGALLRLYKDGVQDANTTSASLVVGTNAIDVRIGAYMQSNPFFDVTDGKIDDVRLYNRALSADEIAKLYTAGGGKLNIPARSLSSGLLGYWTMDGPRMTTATATDSTANRNDGTLFNSPGRVAGKLGQALSFNGSTNYVESVAISGKKSISLWIKTSSSSQQQFFDGGTISVLDQAYEIGLTQTGGVGSGPPTNTAGVYVAFWGNDAYLPATNLADGKWHHVVSSWDGGTSLRVAVDGTYPQGYIWDGTNWSSSLQTQPFTLPRTPVPSNQTVRFGGNVRSALWAAGNRYFAGSMDEVRIYNRALSTSEIQQLYNLGGR